jgi:hypothetical protein
LKRGSDGLARLIGRSPDSLSIQDRSALAGWWIALERYTPATIPLRRIEAIAESPAACARQLAARGLRAADFEYMPILPSF